MTGKTRHGGRAAAVRSACPRGTRRIRCRLRRSQDGRASPWVERARQGRRAATASTRQPGLERGDDGRLVPRTRDGERSRIGPRHAGPAGGDCRAFVRRCQGQPLPEDEVGVRAMMDGEVVLTSEPQPLGHDPLGMVGDD